MQPDVYGSVRFLVLYCHHITMAKKDEKKENKRLLLNPNEIAFRKVYSGLLEDGKISVIFRPEQRLCGDFRGYCTDQNVTIKIIDKVGADWAMIPPKFAKGFSKNARITNVETKKIGELKGTDFDGSSPDIHNKESLKYYLGIIYNISDKELTDDFIVTKTTFTYL